MLEIHDSLGQYLTSVKIDFDILKRESDSLGENHRTLLVESAETLEKCVQEVRSVSYLLHPLLAALRWYTAGFSLNPIRLSPIALPLYAPLAAAESAQAKIQGRRRRRARRCALKSALEFPARVTIDLQRDHKRAMAAPAR